MPFAADVTRLPNEQFWAGWFNKDRAKMLPRPLRRVFEPLNFYESGREPDGLPARAVRLQPARAARASARLKRGQRYDLVHDVQCLGWGLLPLSWLGLPVVTTVHHPLSVDRRASFDRDRNLREALGTMEFYPVGMQAAVARRMDCVFTSSRVSARALERDFGVSPRRLRMVANGVDTELFAPDASAVRDPHELLCVGRAGDPNKGVRTLIEALAQVPAPARLTLVDDDHRDNPARGWAERAGVAERVQIAGRRIRGDAGRLYGAPALVVVPSRYEGFGLPAAEAMACGTPGACAAGRAARCVETGGGGVLVARDDRRRWPRASASCSRILCCAPQLGARGRQAWFGLSLAERGRAHRGGLRPSCWRRAAGARPGSPRRRGGGAPAS